MADSEDISAPALAISDYQTLAEFRYLLRQFLTFSESVARRAGLTAQQHQALLENDSLDFEAELLTLDKLLKTDGFGK